VQASLSNIKMPQIKLVGVKTLFTFKCDCACMLHQVSSLFIATNCNNVQEANHMERKQWHSIASPGTFYRCHNIERQNGLSKCNSSQAKNASQAVSSCTPEWNLHSPNRLANHSSLSKFQPFYVKVVVVISYHVTSLRHLWDTDRNLSTLFILSMHR